MALLRTLQNPILSQVTLRRTWKLRGSRVDPIKMKDLWRMKSQLTFNNSLKRKIWETLMRRTTN